MAYSMTLFPAPSEEDSTIVKTWRGNTPKSNQNIPPKTFPKNIPSHTLLPPSSQSSFPRACATNGAVIVGKNAARKYTVKKH
mmetsp:Transcript_9054/g.18873  ORF Transcript_9054/g.18873 Transcript_9054/m.18873 type:complete len:82 (-) Transcript_9054:780-1025(-)